MKQEMNGIVYSEKILTAIEEKRPVVVVETAGTFEGVSYPDNMRVAENLENAILQNGAEPAFVAIIDGVIHVGLTLEEKERIANPPAPLLKASRRDFPILMAKKQDALASVAASMLIADLCQIPVVAGGGIGGVHRDYANCLDVSADLEEFAKSNVLVVCSGAKSIMDLPFTMEYMETHSVPLVGYQTKELPAYLARTSGLKLDHSIESPEQAAAIYQAKNMLGLPGGILVANPIPAEYSVDVEEMDQAIQFALKKVKEQNVKGKAVTKFILNIVTECMGADSHIAAEKMNYNNAELAAKIAVCLNLH